MVQQPEPTLKDHLEVLDASDRSLIINPRYGKSGQKLRSRALKARNALGLHYFNPENMPVWAQLALNEADTFIALAHAEKRPAPEGVDELIEKVTNDFGKLRSKTAFNLKSYLNTIVRDARVNFVVDGELLRKRVREIIDPNAPQADVELAAWGARASQADHKRDWVVMQMPIPDEIVSNERIAASGFQPWAYEAMQTALWKQSFAAAARISTANECYQKAIVDLALSDQSQGLT